MYLIDVLFFLCLLTLLYIFVGYPLLLDLVAKRKKQEHVAGDARNKIHKDITIILCVYNGAHRLKERIDNLLNNGYPKEHLYITVVSDGSTDNPKKAIEEMNNERVSLIHYKQNKGKSHALNLGIKNSSTELLVFADIRQMFRENTISQLVLELDNEGVGAVSGNLQIAPDKDNSESDPGLYWRYEKWIRENQSRVGTLLGVTGAVYAAKKSLIPVVPQNTLLDDMYIPLSIVKQNYVVKFSKDAVAFDVSSTSLSEEFSRKTRTLAGNFQLLSLLPWLRSPFSNPVFGQFFSHKILRLIMPYCLIGLFVSSLLSEYGLLNSFALVQLAFYLYSFCCYCTAKRGRVLPLSSAILSFCSLNLASFLSGWKYYFLPIQSLWKKH